MKYHFCSTVEKQKMEKQLRGKDGCFLIGRCYMILSWNYTIPTFESMTCFKMGKPGRKIFK